MSYVRSSYLLQILGPAHRFIAAILIMLFIFPYTAGSENLTGREVMEKVFNRYDGDDAYFKIEMILVIFRSKECILEEIEAHWCHEVDKEDC